MFDASRGAISTLNFVRVIGGYPRAWEVEDSLYDHFLGHYIITLSKEFENIDQEFAPYYKNLYNWLFNVPPSIQVNDDGTTTKSVTCTTNYERELRDRERELRERERELMKREQAINLTVSHHNHQLMHVVHHAHHAHPSNGKESHRSQPDMVQGITPETPGPVTKEALKLDLRCFDKLENSCTSILPETPRTIRYSSSSRDLSSEAVCNFGNLLNMMDEYEPREFDVCEKVLVVLVELDKKFKFFNLRDDLFDMKPDSKSLKKLRVAVRSFSKVTKSNFLFTTLALYSSNRFSRGDAPALRDGEEPSLADPPHERKPGSHSKTRERGLEARLCLERQRYFQARRGQARARGGTGKRRKVTRVRKLLSDPRGVISRQLTGKCYVHPNVGGSRFILLQTLDEWKLKLLVWY